MSKQVLIKKNYATQIQEDCTDFLRILEKSLLVAIYVK